MARTSTKGNRRVKKTAARQSDSSANRRVQARPRALTGIWIMLMGLFFLQALFYAWCRVQCVNTGYGIDREMRRRQALVKERSTLNIELARLKSPQRIEAIAREQLGLVVPDAGQTVRLP